MALRTDGPPKDRQTVSGGQALLQEWGPLIWAPQPGNVALPSLLFFWLALARAPGRAAFASLHHMSTTGSLHRADPFSLTFPLMRKQIPGMAAALEGQSHHSVTAPWLCP